MRRCPFTFGFRYIVRQDTGRFKKGEVLIFLDDAYSRWDSMTGYFFKSLDEGVVKRWDIGDEEHLAIWKQFFREIGGWSRPRTRRRRHLLQDHSSAHPRESHLEMMRKHVACLKALAEGDEDLPNWFEWWARHEDELRRALSRMQFLKLKFDTLNTVCAILDSLGVRYTRSDRYDWLRIAPSRSLVHDRRSTFERVRRLLAGRSGA